MTLTLAPDYVFSTKISFQTLVNRMENGVEQRRPQRSREIDGFTLNYKNRRYADMNTIVSLFRSCMGQYLSFTFTNPEDSNTYTVRFVSDDLQRDLIAGATSVNGLWNFKFDVIQVLS